MLDLETYRHKEWLGYIQPVGLVVSPFALVAAQAITSPDVIPLQNTLTATLRPDFTIPDFTTLATSILEWQPDDLDNNLEHLKEYQHYIKEYEELLTADYLVIDPDNSRPLMLVKCLEKKANLDKLDTTTVWHATKTAKFERLLRETQVYTGLLYNQNQLRLIYTPAGETAGHLTFNLEDMTTVAGRVILGALELLLSANRVFNSPKGRTLIDILQNSRKYQGQVTTKLSQQVLSSLWELLKGFQAAQDNSKGILLKEVTPEQLYGGLISILLRLVFLLYAEDEGLMPQDLIYTRNYGVTGLYSKLERDAANYTETMDGRYGAYAGLLSLFRLVYSGGGHLPNYLPARVGELFDPNIYPFLEGNIPNPSPYPIPLISDGVIYRILQNLIVLDGERLSYRLLDVEQIGSVYEAMIGYQVEITTSTSIGVHSQPSGSKTSLTIVISLEELLQAKDRIQYLQDHTGCKLTGNSLNELKTAKSFIDLAAAIGNKVSPFTSYIMPVGSLYLQPTQTRRRSGSHYTPQSMTERIVQDTLRPIFERLGEAATEKDILELKVCDLAMGSGAFLVEACRQLAQRLVQSWTYYNTLPEKNTDDEDEYFKETLLYARRLVAQKCLYGVDLNPFAVNLAKLSLWLVTSAKDHPFTFLDHALKCGDSLLGLMSSQINAFTWIPQKAGSELGGLFAIELQDGLNVAKTQREEISTLALKDYEGKQALNNLADLALTDTKYRGNLVIESFFSANNKKARAEKRHEFLLHWDKYKDKGIVSQDIISCGGARLASNTFISSQTHPFHWHIEFPEVFDRPNSGFDLILGNPPFMGKNTAINAHVVGYPDWLKEVYSESHGNADLVAYFFRRAFELLRKEGTLGLIATNTISQGDTRNTGLKYICQNGGTIYQAQKRFKWPGMAAVIVSVINIYKGQYKGIKLLDNKAVELISAFLFHAGGNDDPKPLLANSNKSFQGSIVLGMGFTFVAERSETSRRDDSNPQATSKEEMQRLIEKDSRNKECIFPYIGGEEVNNSPTHTHHRYVINFGEMSEDEARKYPDLIGIVEKKVKPERDVQKRDALRIKWWQYAEKRPGLVKTIAPLDRVLVIPRVSQYASFTFLPNKIVYSEQLVVIANNKYSNFAILQSRIHEIWARFFSSSFGDGLRYTPSDCFETFPFPTQHPKDPPRLLDASLAPLQDNILLTPDPTLEETGQAYYEYRAALMIKNKQGLTETYNRFHNPIDQEVDILQLRTLHEEMDRTVLDAYGWTDLDHKCTFILDYLDEEEPEDNPNKKTSKKPWRYRYSDEIRDEVLARLLELNEQRHLEEVLRGDQAEKKPKSKTHTKSVYNIRI